MQEHIKVPQDRIGVIIGVEGNVKKVIEEKTGCKMSVDSESGSVIIESEAEPIKALKASETIKAIARGFSPDKAFRLLDNEDLMLDILDLSNISDSPVGPDAHKGSHYRESRQDSRSHRTDGRREIIRIWKDHQHDRRSGTAGDGEGCHRHAAGWRSAWRGVQLFRETPP